MSNVVNQSQINLDLVGGVVFSVNSQRTRNPWGQADHFNSISIVLGMLMDCQEYSVGLKGHF